jgi:sulfatase maturation enzyme AslB (radical SAM superfamily)
MVSANKYPMFDKKILCLGNNSEDTDHRTTRLATQNNTINYGLITDSTFVPGYNGYYHTTILDISFGSIVELAKYFDQILFFDQPINEWSHWKPMLSTYKIMLELDRQGYNTVYKHNNNIKQYLIFSKMLEDNKSFCIYPWINLIEEQGHLNVCARSVKKVTTIQELKDWKTDPNYTKIRQDMLNGKMLPDHCEYCYNYEKKGIESYRQFETKEWLSKLGISSLEDLEKIDRPYYYEIRLSNKCNLMCRSCKPEHSHLIDKEYKKFKIEYPDAHLQTFKYSSLAHVDLNKLTPDTRVYLTGGEPTVIAEVLTFMEQCISSQQTSFDFTLGTNAAKLSPKFLKLSKHFTNMNFSVSLDGYGKINDYWRWGSNWDTVIANTHILKDQGHTISINCVPGIYNVTNLHLLYEFLDKEFPHAGIYLQINHVGIQSAYNHPNSKLVVESMTRCQQTKTYYIDGKSNRTAIDSLLNYYSNDPECNLQDLRAFFEYNDQLDRARNVQLKDYIPELEACRILVDQ